MGNGWLGSEKVMGEARLNAECLSLRQGLEEKGAPPFFGLSPSPPSVLLEKCTDDVGSERLYHKIHRA